jgi:hypothetical protein
MSQELAHYILSRLAEAARWENRDCSKQVLAVYDERMAQEEGKNLKRLKVDRDYNIAADPSGERKALWSAFDQAITFKYADAPQFKGTDLMEAVKIIVAHGLELEPGLVVPPAIEKNAILASIAKAYVRAEEEQDNDCEFDLFQDSSWRDNPPEEEKPVRDFSATLPRHFCINASSFSPSGEGVNGFELAMTSSSKELVLNRALFYKHAAALQSGFKVSHASTDNGARILQTMKEQNHQIRMENGKSWYAVALQSKDAKNLTDALKKIMGQNLPLEAPDFAAFQKDEDTIVVGCEQESFDRAWTARLASLEMLRIIDEGLPGGIDPKTYLAELLRDGADLRYVDPEAVSERNETFANRMRENERFELLGALKAIKGVHDITFAMPALRAA